jgi:fatty-acyl-CoA synthase
MVNLSAFIRFHALRNPEQVALIYGDLHITYAEFYERIRRLAGFMRDRGIGEGDVVAVLMKNSPAFLEAAFATSHLGAIFLPVNFRLAREEVAYITGDGGAALVLADRELAGSVEGLPGVVLLGPDTQADSRSLGGVGAALPAPAPRGTQDLFRLLYTSGTTSHPKGVMHTYENFYWKCMDHVIALGLSAADRLLVAGPLYHVGAFDLPGLAVLWVGGTFCVIRDFDPKAALAAIERERLTGAWLAPVMLGRILSCPERERFDLSSIAWTIGGGERTPEPRIHKFAALFPNARYVDGYGLTESCGGDTLMEAGHEIERIGSTGRALAHVEVRIRDDGGADLPPGVDGEIVMRGPKITQGYWNDPDETAQAVRNGWLYTGDVGHLDEDGFLYLTDRKKDMILSGGENIASFEVERVIDLMPQVAEVSVIGLPDEKWGEIVVAVAVPAEGAALDYKTLAGHCREHLAGFKVPKRLILRDVLPRNPSGKALKRVLREEIANETAGETP